MVVGGIIIGYSYLGTTNSNFVYSSDRSNLLGDWHDIHGVGLFNTEGSNDDDDNSIYLATHNGLYNKKQNSSWVKVGSLSLIHI